MITEFGVVWMISPIISVFFLLIELAYTPLSILECFFASIPLGFAISNWVTYLASCYFGRLTIESLQISNTFFITFAILFFFRVIIKLLRRRNFIFNELLSSKLAIFLTSLAILVFAPIYSFHYLNKINNDYMSGGTTWGDMGLHLHIIQSFLKGQNTKLSFYELPKSPIFSGSSLQYSFFPDFHAASFILTGATERESLIIPSLLLVVSIVLLLYFLNSRLLGGDKPAAFFAVIIFFLSGGIGFFYWIFEHGMSIQSIEHFDFVEKVQEDSRHNLFWFGAIPHILLPQRQAIYAFGIVLFVFILFSIIFEQKIYMRKSFIIFFLAGASSSLLPTIQQHSFLAISFIVLAHFLLNPKNAYSPRRLAGWIFFILPILFFALPSAVIFLGKSASNGGDFFRISLMWGDDYVSNSFFPTFENPLLNSIRNLISSVYAPIIFWIRALWLIVPFAMVGSIFLPKTKSQKRFLFAGWFVFIIANLAQFQSWKGDNIKLFYIWMMISCSAVASVCMRFMRSRKPLVRVLFLYIFLTMIFSGSLALYREYRQSYVFYNDEDIKFGNWVDQNTPLDAVFLSSQNHINPVSVVAGRTVFAGYAGWLLAHGYYEYDARLQLIDKMITAASVPSTLMELRQNNINYLVVDHMNRNNVNFAFYDEHYQLVYSSNNYQVYKIFYDKK